MIKNIIFDIGDVLLQFDYNNKVFKSLTPKEQEIIVNLIHSPEWEIIDYGYLSNQKLIKIFQDKTNHECDKAIARFVNSWTNYGFISLEIISILDILRKNGYKVFLLSNIDKHMHKRINDFALIDHVDGYMFSYLVKQIKPYDRIYLNLLNSYSLNAEECLFIDDRQANIDTAIKLGIKAKKVIPGNFNDVINILKSYNINIDR